MLVSSVSFALLLVTDAVVAANPIGVDGEVKEAAVSSYRPLRVSLDDLLHSSDARDTLRTEGIVAITNAFSQQRGDRAHGVLESLESCLLDQQAAVAQTVTFPDGTVRTTLARQNTGAGTDVPTGDNSDVFSSCGGDNSSEEASIQAFRRTVGEATRAVAYRLADLWGLHDTPLLYDTDGSAYTLTDIVSQGDHLEHFHVYQKSHEQPTSSATIDWHIDQGLFLLFTPGLVNGSITRDFYVKRPDGSTALVEFDRDDLILMLGDGVDQYVNPSLPDGQPKLRPVPHAVRMTATNNNRRLWYGRMVLPPPSCVHPRATTSSGHKTTFGAIREGMIQDAAITTSQFTGLGCSSSTMRVSRELQDQCDPATSVYCWHRCMNYTDFEGVSVDGCAEQGLDVACANADGFLWNEKHDPQFALYCLDVESAEVYAAASGTFAPTTYGSALLLLPVLLVAMVSF